MLNADVARKALEKIYDETHQGVVFDNISILQDFINEVERLLHYNAIKQTPALFKVVKDG